MQEQTIFDLMYQKFKIDKPVRLIEMFAGYGSQALALKYLNVNFEHWRICEWAVKSIQAYKDIHFEDDSNDYSATFDIDYIKDFLLKKGISQNYIEPMNEKQIKKMTEHYARNVFNNIIATHNLVNIQQAKGQDLEIKDLDKYIYIFTYSFPCQDLSMAGKRQGMNDTTTRSGMLWEVERILSECKEIKTLPQVLLMENVPQVHDEINKDDFKKWLLRLEELGYKNYFQDLIATDYGIPQTRNRCFMISVLGDYSYSFPPKQPLKLKLKDLLEDNVEEKYYLSDKMLNYVMSRMPSGENKITTGINMGNKETLNNAGTLTTGEGNKPNSNFIIENDNYDYSKKQGEIIEKNFVARKYGLFDKEGKKRQAGSVYDENGFAPTLDTATGGYRQPLIEEKNYKKVNQICNELVKEKKVNINDTLYTNYTTRRIKENDFIQNNNISPTLTTSATEIGVVVENQNNDNHKEETLTTRGDCVGICVNEKPKVLGGIGEKKSNGGTQWYQQDRIYDNNVSIALATGFNPYYKADLRIRKLTPNECFRLMGVKDEDFEKVKKNQSNASLYHLAGDSIVVNVLMAIFGEML